MSNIYHNPANPPGSRTERLTDAYGRLLTWSMNHKAHPLSTCAFMHTYRIIERIDQYRGGDGLGGREHY